MATSINKVIFFAIVGGDPENLRNHADDPTVIMPMRV